MLIAENITAVVVFVAWLVAFALGYALRNRVDETRAEFADTFTYRHKRTHTDRYRQIDNVSAHGVGAYRS